VFILPQVCEALRKDIVSLHGIVKKNTEWKWENEQQKAFEQLKEALSTDPVLMTPDYSKPFNISSDACASGVGCVSWKTHQFGQFKQTSFGTYLFQGRRSVTIELNNHMNTCN